MGSSTSTLAVNGPVPKRYDIYVVDTGRCKRMSAVLETHLELFKSHFLERANHYHLTQSESAEVLRANPQLIGADPLLVVVDSDAMVEKHKGGHGFRCCLGMMTSPAEANDMLRELLLIMLEHDKARNLNLAIGKRIHKAGLNGAMQIIGKSLEASHGG